jgi:hypothetical protein
MRRFVKVAPSEVSEDYEEDWIAWYEQEEITKKDKNDTGKKAKKGGKKKKKPKKGKAKGRGSKKNKDEDDGEDDDENEEEGEENNDAKQEGGPEVISLVDDDEKAKPKVQRRIKLVHILAGSVLQVGQHIAPSVAVCIIACSITAHAHRTPTCPC